MTNTQILLLIKSLLLAISLPLTVIAIVNAKEIFRRVKVYLLKIPKDKKEHFAVGFIMAITLIPAFGYIGALIGVFIAGAKEVVYDWLMKKGTPEWWDFIATIIPIILISLIKYL